jgi:DNA-directed RNA polymerase specialized sigma24 family protein
MTGVVRWLSTAPTMRDDSGDRLLRQFLAATTDPEVEDYLTHILDPFAKPIIRGIVASTLRDVATRDDVEDIVSETVVHLLRRLRDLKSNSSEPIEDLRGYIATCAHNRCHERLRDRYPARNRLRNQLRYLINHDPELAMWRSRDGRLICGYRRWTGQEAVSGDAIEELRIAARSDPGAENRAQIAALVLNVFKHVRAPVDLDNLVKAIARLIGLEESRHMGLVGASQLSSPTAVDCRLELQLSLRQLWEDIQQLALRQRKALLLNLRDRRGGEVLSLLPRTRTATIAEIARAVEMPLMEFATLWRDLPLSDAAIAALLGATPQQVIKLRRLARERLHRISKRREEAATTENHKNVRSGVR